MPSPIHSSPLPNCRTIAYLNSLPLLELGTNLPRPSPGEVLSFLAFHQETILILILIHVAMIEIMYIFYAIAMAHWGVGNVCYEKAKIK